MLTADLIDLPRDVVHLWLMREEDFADAKLVQSCRDNLDEEERARERLRATPLLKRRFTLSHSFLRSVLSCYAPVAPRDWRFRCTQFGKPEIRNRLNLPYQLFFNLTHTPGLAACAVTRVGAVGVDFERIRDTLCYLGAAASVCARCELQRLATMPPGEMAAGFFQYWTLKEAFAKAEGRGLQIPFKHIQFDMAGDLSIEVRIDPVVADCGGDWQFWSVDLVSGCVGAVCLQSSGRRDVALYSRLVTPQSPCTAWEGPIQRLPANGPGGARAGACA